MTNHDDIVGKRVSVQMEKWQGGTAPEGKWVPDGPPLKATVVAVGCFDGSWALLLRDDQDYLRSRTVGDGCKIRVLSGGPL
jgi:hypothetical protein